MKFVELVDDLISHKPANFRDDIYIRSEVISRQSFSNLEHRDLLNNCIKNWNEIRKKLPRSVDFAICGAKGPGPVFLGPIGTLHERRPRGGQKRVWRPLAEKVFTGASGGSDPLKRVPAYVSAEKHDSIGPRVQELWGFEIVKRKPPPPPSGIFSN